MAETFYVTDSTLSERFPLYTRANVGEVFPDPVTPFTSGTILFLAEEGWRDAWVRMGAFDADEFPPGEFCQLGVVGGYCYLNASLIRLFGVRAPGLTWQDMDAQFFGAQPGVPDYEAMPGDERLDLTETIGATFGWALGQHSLGALTPLTEHRERTKALRAARPDLSTLSDQQLWDAFEALIPEHRIMFGEHLFTTYLATVPVGIISAVATAVGRPDLIMAIIAGIGEVDSAAPSHDMWAMGRTIAGSPFLTAQFDQGVPGLLGRLATEAASGVAGAADAQQFLKAFEAFLVEFGSRGPNEWEPRSPTWETKPELALGAIERMRVAKAEQDPAVMNAARANEREAAASTLLSIVEADPATHGQLAAAIAATSAWLPGRERTKTNNIRLIHEMRMLLRELGRRMVQRNAFDEIEDFGFVQQEEIPTLLSDPSSLTDRVRQRRAEYLELQQLVPPFVFSGSTEGPTTWPRRDASTEARLTAGESLSGIPGCSGVAEGRARVILDSNDPSALEPGDILVAPITDPSWTPLFVPAAGVIVDVGAPLSHAIIVSRELGIPCVVSATNATRRIPDGAQVRVDGNTGVITVLSA
jgi:rifampicin phosphotransferase